MVKYLYAARRPRTLDPKDKRRHRPDQTGGQCPFLCSRGIRGLERKGSSFGRAFLGAKREAGLMNCPFDGSVPRSPCLPVSNSSPAVQGFWGCCESPLARCG